MYKNIKHNNVRGLRFKLRYDKYYDFMLYRGDVSNSRCDDGCVVSDINVENFSDNKIYSSAIWEKSVNNGVKLENIGFTGVDNGLISYRRDKITNSQFLDIYVNSELTLEPDDKRFFMFPVTGNSNQYKYYYTMEDTIEDGKYMALKGGFLQGFFKLYDEEYQVLPDKIENDWNLEFVLRKKDYEIEHRTLNSVNSNNNGIFFYIGTRAENKFWYLYKKNELTEGLFKGECHDDGYFLDFNPVENNVINHDYLSYEENDLEINSGYNSQCDCTCNIPIEDDGYMIDGYFSDEDCDEKNAKSSCLSFKLKNDFLNRQDFLDFSLCCSGGKEDDKKEEPCIIDGYFSDDYMLGDNAGLPFNEEYFEKEISLDGINLKTTEGHDLDKKGYFEIITDNKFLTFDRTKYGFTTKTYDDDNRFVAFEGRNDWGNINYFTLMNRTSSGYTTKNIFKYNENNSKAYDIYKDLRENCFALKVNEDGSIGYRYGITDCNEDSKFKVIEEYSKPNIIKNDEWVTINVRMFIISSDVMKLYFYVNGRLVFISKELPVLKLRELNDVSEKQETVPYNISVGGGTQGLADAIWLNYYHKANYLLPLEEYFAGTFIGDFKSFKFYNCFREYNDIKNSVFKV